MVLDWIGVILGIAVGALTLFGAWLMVVAALGLLIGERFERCPRCHHHALTVHGRVHPQGCPIGHLQRLEHLHLLHLRDGSRLHHHR